MAGVRRLGAAGFAPAKLFQTVFSKLHGGGGIINQPNKPGQKYYLSYSPTHTNVLNMFIGSL